MANLNERFAESFLGKYFKVKERKTDLWTECRGGFVSFLTSCYILAVNAGIIAQTGGTCVDSDNPRCPNGPGSLGDSDCQDCLQTLQRQLIAATAAACIISHFVMGVAANMPLAICPGMGINAYFAFTVVGFMGTGRVPYRQALAAVFIEGLVFIVIAAVGFRNWIMDRLPKSIMFATAGGIGLFLTFLGLQAAEGIAVTTYNSATLVTLGGCDPQYRSYQYTFSNDDLSSACTLNETNGEAIPNSNLWLSSGTYSCGSAGIMRAATMWLGISGGMLMAAFLAKGVRGALIYGILFVTFISWIPTSSNHAAYLGEDSTIPGGQDRLDYFKKVAVVPNTDQVAGKLDFSGFGNGDLWLALLTFLYVDFLDATGTLFSMATFMATTIPNFVDEKTKRFERQTITMCVDGFSTVIGSLFGLSPITIYIESAAGIKEGARTGIAALVISLCFFIALWFSPLIAAIPPYATGPALILVGAMMMTNVTKIEWDKVGEAVPAFLTIAIMPLTFSIAYGLIAGIISWIWINGMVFLWNMFIWYAFPQWRPDEQDKSVSDWQNIKQMTFKVHRGDTMANIDLGENDVSNAGKVTSEVESDGSK